MRNHPEPLHELCLLTAGGTIDSDRDEGGGYRPCGDHVARFVTGHMKGSYDCLSEIPVASLDSSNMTIDAWIELLHRMRDELGLEIHEGFDKEIGAVITSPFTTTDDHLNALERLNGLVVAGCGAGNANASNDRFSLLKALEQTNEPKPVVLGSLVPLQGSDPEYGVLRDPIERAECIPAGLLSFQACAVRASAPLGRKPPTRPDYVRRGSVNDLVFRNPVSAEFVHRIVASGESALTEEV